MCAEKTIPTTLQVPISEDRYIAEHNTILRATIGSKAHGLNIDGYDDTDEMGVCIPPPEFVLGLRLFEQWTYRTKPTGVRSGPGDLDLTIYSLKKFVGLAARGNPSILTLLYLPLSAYTSRGPGLDLVRNRDWFISKDALRAYLGYMTAQKERLFGERGQKRVNRPELVEKYGYDTKYAMHVIRLGMQGCEIAVDSKISLPMPEAQREECLKIRTGFYSIEYIEVAFNTFKNILELYLNKNNLPDHADMNKINKWLVKAHQDFWSRSESKID